MNKIILGIVLGTAISFSGAPAIHAGPYTGIHPLQSDRFVFGAGGYWAAISSAASLHKKGTPLDNDVDFQDDLGFDDTDIQPAFVFTWRFSERSRIEGEYFSVTQGNTATTEKTIEWDDAVYKAGARLDARFDMDIGRVFYGYSFLKTDRQELGAGAGMHYLGLDTSLSGQASVNGKPVTDTVKRGIDDWAVLPNIGAYGNHAFSSKWLVSGRVDWISANIGDYDGTLWNAQASVQYQVSDHFGIGLSYRYLSLDLEEDSRKRRWDIDIDYSGPMLFITANF